MCIVRKCPIGFLRLMIESGLEGRLQVIQLLKFDIKKDTGVPFKFQKYLLSILNLMRSVNQMKIGKVLLLS